MRHPTRTRRLSIAAMASLLAFVVVAGASIRSLWTWDLFAFGTWQGIAIEEGCIVYLRSLGAGRTGHISSSIYDEHASVPWGISGFYIKKVSLPPNAFKELSFVLAVPLWPLLALLLISPVRWLIARSSAAPVFPVVIKQLQRPGEIPLMAHQKPTLEYGKAEPPSKDWQFDMTACVVCSIVGVGFLLSSGLSVLDIIDDGYGVLFKPVFGLLLLWFAWWFVKRR